MIELFFILAKQDAKNVWKSYVRLYQKYARQEVKQYALFYLLKLHYGALKYLCMKDNDNRTFEAVQTLQESILKMEKL
jgi:hypothetical protein